MQEKKGKKQKEKKETKTQIDKDGKRSIVVLEQTFYSIHATCKKNFYSITC